MSNGRTPPAAHAASATPSRCDLCGGTRLALRHPARGGAPGTPAAFACTSFGHRHHPPIWRCTDCGLLFQWPLPSAQQLQGAYEAVEDPLYVEERENRYLTFRRVLRALGPGEGRTLLDVGAYCGYFLDVAREGGFRAEGLELSRWAAAQARGLGFTVHGTPLRELVGTGARYDVVTLWDVVEHLVDPRAELQAAAALLPAGGRLYLSTIDAGSLVARALGGAWPWLMDMHLVYFDRATVTRLLEQAGFRVESIRTYTHIVSAGYLAKKLQSSFPRAAPLFRGVGRALPAHLPVPFNLGDNMLVSAVRV